MEARPRWGPKAASPEMGWEPNLPVGAQAASFRGGGWEPGRKKLPAEDSRARETVSTGSESTWELVSPKRGWRGEIFEEGGR